MNFNAVTAITTASIVESVMKRAITGHLDPVGAAVKELAGKTGWELFREEDVLRIFTYHATEHDRKYAPFLGRDVFMTIAYWHSEAEAKRIVGVLQESYRGEVTKEDFQAVVDDDDITDVFFKNGRPLAGMFYARNETAKHNNEWWDPCTAATDKKASPLIRPREHIRDFMNRRASYAPR